MKKGWVSNGSDNRVSLLLPRLLLSLSIQLVWQATAAYSV